MAGKQKTPCPSNTDCINAGPLGLGCQALTDVQPGCLAGACPFFKTKEENEAQEAKCKERAEHHGYTYKTREETYASYYIIKAKKETYYHDVVRDRRRNQRGAGERDQH